MCKSKSDGGKRCSRKSSSHRSREKLLSQKRYLESIGATTQGVLQKLDSLEIARAQYGDIVISHDMSIDHDTERLLERLRDKGMNPLIVGGAVRDSLSTGEEPKDIDIEVHQVGSMDELVAALRSSGYRVDEVGRTFGVLKTVLPDGTDIDISLPRRDNMVGAGHRGFEIEVDPEMNVYEAASRRDFTINALYYDHGNKVVVDPYGGADDLSHKVLRHVSDAYTEDPLRVLRGVQIASRFNLEMAEETIEASREIHHRYNELPNERVQEEWRKFMIKGSRNLTSGLKVLHSTGWDTHLGLDGLDRDGVARRAEGVISLAQRRGEDAEAFGTASFALEVPEGKRDKFVRTVLVGVRRQRFVQGLVSIGVPEGLSSRKAVNKWARNIGKKGVTVKQWETLYSKRAEPSEKAYIRKVADLARKNGSYEAARPDLITGEMVLEASQTLQGGRWVGEILADAKHAQDNEEFRDEEKARAWLMNRLNSSRNVDNQQSLR